MVMLLVAEMIVRSIVAVPMASPAPMVPVLAGGLSDKLVGCCEKQLSVRWLCTPAAARPPSGEKNLSRGNPGV